MTTSRACSIAHQPPRAFARIALSTSFGRSTVNWNDGSMACAETRDAIADALMARQPLDAGAERHLATCAECRAYRAETEAMWAHLAELPTPAPSRDARVR